MTVQDVSSSAARQDASSAASHLLWPASRQVLLPLLLLLFLLPLCPASVSSSHALLPLLEAARRAARAAFWVLTGGLLAEGGAEGGVLDGVAGAPCVLWLPFTCMDTQVPFETALPDLALAVAPPDAGC